MGTDSPSEAPAEKPKKREVPEIEEALEKLALITRLLRSASSLVVMMAGFSLALLVAGMLSTKFFRQADAASPGSMMVYGAVMMAGMGLFFLFTWEQRRRRGKLYYEEISDEVEWRHRSLRSKNYNSVIISSGSIISGDNISNGSPPPENGTPKAVEAPKVSMKRKPRRRPDLAIRIVLREYLNASTLPFGSGEWSGTLYVVWFLVVLLAAVFGLGVHLSGY